MMPLDINIGSGPHYAEGWLNVDIDKSYKPDLVADISDLPSLFDPQTFAHAYVGHVLEHIEWGKELTDAIQAIGYLAQKIMVVGPCIEKARATNQPSNVIDAIIPDENATGPGSHKWMPSESMTAEAIRLAGYTPHIIDICNVTLQNGWPNVDTAPWQCAMWFSPAE